MTKIKKISKEFGLAFWPFLLPTQDFWGIILRLRDIYEVLELIQKKRKKNKLEKNQSKINRRTWTDKKLKNLSILSNPILTNL